MHKEGIMFCVYFSGMICSCRHLCSHLSAPIPSWCDRDIQNNVITSYESHACRAHLVAMTVWSLCPCHYKGNLEQVDLSSRNSTFSTMIVPCGIICLNQIFNAFICIFCQVQTQSIVFFPKLITSCLFIVNVIYYLLNTYIILIFTTCLNCNLSSIICY